MEAKESGGAYGGRQASQYTGLPGDRLGVGATNQSFTRNTSKLKITPLFLSWLHDFELLGPERCSLLGGLNHMHSHFLPVLSEPTFSFFYQLTEAYTT